MGNKSPVVNDRARIVLAQEAARIIVEQGIQDFRIAKNKAAERLGLKNSGHYPATPKSKLLLANICNFLVENLTSISSTCSVATH